MHYAMVYYDAWLRNVFGDNHLWLLSMIVFGMCLAVFGCFDLCYDDVSDNNDDDDDNNTRMA